MDKHNMGFDTFCEVFDSSGKLCRTIGEHTPIKEEGEVQITVYDCKKKVKSKQTQPMRSLISNFFRLFSQGGTLSRPSWGTSQTLTTIGLGSGSGPISFTGDYASTQITSGIAFENHSIIQMPTYDPLTGQIDINLQVRLLRTSGPVTVTNIGLYGTRSGLSNGRGLWIHDMITPISISSGDIIQLNFILHFPASSARMLNQNLLHWLIQPHGYTSFEYRDIENTLSPVSVSSAMGGSGVTLSSMTMFDDDNHGIFPGSGLNYKHICVGSGDADCTMTDYNLDTVIEHGSDSGQLIYLDSTKSGNYSEFRQGDTHYLHTFRDFVNNSSGNITVREAGLFSRPGTSWYDPQKNFLLCRWLTGEIVLQPFETLRIHWNPRITLET